MANSNSYEASQSIRNKRSDRNNKIDRIDQYSPNGRYVQQQQQQKCNCSACCMRQSSSTSSSNPISTVTSTTYTSYKENNYHPYAAPIQQRYSSNSTNINTNTNTNSTSFSPILHPTPISPYTRKPTSIISKTMSSSSSSESSSSSSLSLLSSVAASSSSSPSTSSSSRPSSLRIHTYSHTGENPFVCTEPGCGRKFSVQSNMRRHLRVHRMGRPAKKNRYDGEVEGVKMLNNHHLQQPHQSSSPPLT